MATTQPTLCKTIVGPTFPTSGNITIIGHTLSDTTRDELLSRIDATIGAPESQPTGTARTACGLHFDYLGITPPTPAAKVSGGLSVGPGTSICQRRGAPSGQRLFS